MKSSDSKVHIVGICGSLRKQSYNRMWLRAFEQELSDDVAFTLADLSQIPIYNQDNEDPFPAAVVQLKEMLSSADAVVIASPEYNLSYTAVLKNALEWVSRRALQTNLAGKPVALVGVSAIASSVSQSHLRDVLWALNMNVLNRPIAQVNYPQEKFDQAGNLTDPATRDQVRQVRDGLLEAVHKAK